MTSARDAHPRLCSSRRPRVVNSRNRGGSRVVSPADALLPSDPRARRRLVGSRALRRRRVVRIGARKGLAHDDHVIVVRDTHAHLSHPFARGRVGVRRARPRSGVGGSLTALLCLTGEQPSSPHESAVVPGALYGARWRPGGTSRGGVASPAQRCRAVSGARSRGDAGPPPATSRTLPRARFLAEPPPPRERPRQTLTAAAIAAREAHEARAVNRAGGPRTPSSTRMTPASANRWTPPIPPRASSTTPATTPRRSPAISSASSTTWNEHNSHRP